MSEILQQLPLWQKVIAFIVVIFVAGMTFAFAVGGYAGLPDMVAAEKARNDRQDVRMDGFESKVGEMDRKLDQSICLQLAEKQNSAWQECLRNGAK